MITETNKGIIVLVFTTIIFGIMGFFPRFFEEDFSILQQVYMTSPPIIRHRS